MELLALPIIFLAALLVGWLKGRNDDPSFEFISDNDELVI